MTSKFDEIKARAEKATPAPWTLERWSIASEQQIEDEGATATELAIIVNLAKVPMEAADAEFIAASRTDIPLLLRALELALEHYAADRTRTAIDCADYWLEQAEKVHD